MRVSKRQKQINEKVESTKIYPILDALTLLKEIPNLKFNESIDISINLGVDPQKSDQNVRGSTSLPHGIGKQSKIAVFAEGADATAASEAGADVVGFEDLIEKSNNLLNDNPEIEFLELSTGIDNSPKYETKDELWLKISWYKTPSLKSKSIFEDKSSYSSFSEIIKDE